MVSTGVPFLNSPLCEDNGVDVIVPTRVGLVGFQRKRLPDLEASLSDGRLAKELGQIRSSGIIRHAVIVAEFDPTRITNDGQFLDTRLRPNQVRNLALKCQLLGCLWVQSRSLADTLAALTETANYIASDKAENLYRPKPPTGAWGHRSNAEWAIHLLQSFPNIGPRTAKAIVADLGLPLAWTCSRDQLLRIPGIGAKTADQLLAALRVLPGATPD